MEQIRNERGDKTTKTDYMLSARKPLKIEKSIDYSKIMRKYTTLTLVKRKQELDISISGKADFRTRNLSGIERNIT